MMDILMLFGQLAWTFFVIGAFTIGGGYAMLSLIQNQVVVEHAWISESTFTDIVAVSQMTPGPIGINSATYVGYDVLLNATGSQLLGVCGSLTATLLLAIPHLAAVRRHHELAQALRGGPDWRRSCYSYRQNHLDGHGTAAAGGV